MNSGRPFFGSLEFRGCVSACGHSLKFYIHDWIYENRVNALHHITQMQFDFTTPKDPKVQLTKFFFL